MNMLHLKDFASIYKLCLEIKINLLCTLCVTLKQGVSNYLGNIPLLSDTN